MGWLFFKTEMKAGTVYGTGQKEIDTGGSQKSH